LDAEHSNLAIGLSVTAFFRGGGDSYVQDGIGRKVVGGI